MESKIILTGISFQYKTTIFYEYNDIYMVEFFKCLVGSNILNPINKIKLRYDIGYGKTLFLDLVPDVSEDKWIIDGQITLPFSFTHNHNKNLFDEVEELLPVNASITAPVQSPSIASC